VAEKKQKPTVQNAFYVSLPAKHIVVKVMSDGSVEYEGKGTAFTAMTVAHTFDKKAFQADAEAFVLAGAITTLEDRKKVKT
jgi:hypothetical protein